MDFVSDLKANGFTEKDITRLRAIVESVPTKDQTLASIVLDLSKRFLGGVIGFAIIAICCFLGLLHADEKSKVISYIIGTTFGATVVYIVTPMKLAWKAHRYMAKTK